MASAQGNFLEDDALVAKLNEAKNTSGEIREHLIKAEKTESEINTVFRIGNHLIS